MTTKPATPTTGRRVDTTIPPSCEFNHCHSQQQQHLPFPLHVIPAHVTSLVECAKWQIAALEAEAEAEMELTKTNSNSTSSCGSLEDALDDGFVLCDMNVIAQKLLAWRRLFPRIKPFFALKCNPDPMVAAVLGYTNQGAGFDCASLSEITLALDSTTNNSNLIVYANPQRAERDLEESIRLGITAFTFDGEEELHKIHRAYHKVLEEQTNEPKSEEELSSPQMILRLLVPDEHSTVPLGEKFGAPVTTSRITTLTQQAIQLGMPIVGVSFHCGSGCHNPQAYVKAIELAHDAINTINDIQQEQEQQPAVQPCWLLDIGGGFPGWDGWKGDEGRFTAAGAFGPGGGDNGNALHDVEVETAAKIANAINPLLDQLFPSPSSPHDQLQHPNGRDVDVSAIQIISEPGRYFVEAAFCLCSRIYRVRREAITSTTTSTTTTTHMHYTIAQGVEGVFKDVLLCGESFVPIPLLSSSMDMAKDDPQNKSTMTPLQGEYIPSTIHGPSGKECDIICQTNLPEMQIGDWLLFDRMGAYTLSISARSARPPIRYVMGGWHSSSW